VRPERENEPHVSDAEERELLAACRRRETEALSRLVDLHYEPLYRFLWRLTSSPDTAEELTQEAFVRALDRVGSFDGRARFSTWLHSIAINYWRDTRRRMPKEPALSLDDLPVADEALRCDQQALDRLEQDEVRRAVGRLPEAQRVAILLFYYQEMTYGEIARVCDCPVGTVGSWIHHGIRTLRKMLDVPARDAGLQGSGSPAHAGTRVQGSASGSDRPEHPERGVRTPEVRVRNREFRILNPEP
jgi:RNA polymerase sigma-70 factor, ECF subfamily